MRTSYIIFCLALSACASVRASSYVHLRAEDSTVTLKMPADGAIQQVIAAFSRRGQSVVDRRNINGLLELKFKGSRDNITTIVGANGWTSGGSDNIGSVYFVRLIPNADQSTTLAFFGKPTANGKEVCSDADDELQLECEGFTTGLLWHGRARVTGREEAETIRGLILELSYGSPTPAPSQTAIGPAPVVSGPMVARAPAPAVDRHAECMKARKDIATRASAESNARNRAEIYRTMPSCPKAQK